MRATTYQLTTTITKYVHNADKDYFHSSMDYVCVESKWDSENFLSTKRTVTLGELETVAPIFLLMGSVLILGYLVPVVLGRIDDLRTARTQTKEDQK